MNNIRKSAIAGSWYPGKAKELKAYIAEFLEQVPEESIGGEVIGLVAPHAGYLYSGQVAAYAYKLVVGQVFDAVIVIGPSHRIPFQGVSVYDGAGFETPLGTVPTDIPLAEKIMQQSRIVSSIPHVHLQEHSIEIQLPFLQMALGDFAFVPLLMGSQDRLTCETLATAVYSALGGRKALIVGSSDLSHFHSYNRAVTMDNLILERFSHLDADGLLEDIENNVSEACGGGPAAVTMKVARKLGAQKSKILKYANSGDVTGDKHSVVGYAAAVLFAEGLADGMKDGEKLLREGAGVGLSETEKKMLLRIARETIEARIKGTEISGPTELPEILKEKRGAFVTLKKHGRLRGCIGYIEAGRPLYKTIEEMAIAAAFDDPRFPSLQKEELQDISIEISVLSPLRQIHDIEDIEVGRHGIYIVKGFRSGLLLPQVATEYNWDKSIFLEETCRKAGLPSHAWQDKDTKIFIFSADIFGSVE